MPEIGVKGLTRQQMDRDGIAREGVDHEDIEALWGFPFQRQPPIAQPNLVRSGRIGKVGEMAACQIRHSWVEFVEPIIVARSGVSGQRTGSEADHANTLSWTSKSFDCPLNTRPR